MAYRDLDVTPTRLANRFPTSTMKVQEEWIEQTRRRVVDLCSACHRRRSVQGDRTLRAIRSELNRGGV